MFSPLIHRRFAALLAAAALSFSLPASALPAQPADPPPSPPATDVSAMPWLDAKKTPEERADLLIDAMSEAQLIHMLHGASSLIGTRKDDGGPKSIGYVPAIPELRIPALVLTDGPSGLRNREPATQMPAPIAHAASWDVTNVYDVGKAIAEDAKDRGQDLLFGPGFNLGRVPVAGRTFEYFGEDPYLSGMLAAANVRGLQETGIMANLKHYVANNQELNRTLSSSNMDSRTLHEIYEKPFEIAVAESDPASVMCAYNKINHVYACSNHDTLVTDLRGRMGFRGFVVSDYPATHAASDIRNGLNIELPNAQHTSEKNIRKAIDAGELSWDDVRARVRETLVQMFRFGLFDHPWDESRGDRLRNMREIPAERGYEAALSAAEAGSVLLENDGILPLDPDPSAWVGKRILIVGEGAKNAASGGGSSQVTSLKKDSFLEEFTKRMPADTTVVWKSAWDPVGIDKEAKQADLVIVVAKVISTELFDRLNLDFFPHMNHAVKTATNVNDNTIVVTQLPGPTLMPWSKDVRAILNVWYPGAAGGKATTNLLFGDVNPSGRLPQTFPASNQQSPIQDSKQFPGDKAGFESNYTEGVFIGYRWFDREHETPAYPFGYGLSYTTFSYSDATLARDSGRADDNVRVRFRVTNTGTRAGALVPQVYVGKPATAELATPPKELAAFTKVELEPGESRQVELTVKPDQLSVFDPTLADGFGDFIVQPGTYRIYLADHANAVKSSWDYRID